MAATERPEAGDGGPDESGYELIQLRFMNMNALKQNQSRVETVEVSNADLKDSQFIRWRDRTIEGIVFDLDGTLIDSIQVYYEIFRETTAQFGIQLKREGVFESIAMGSFVWDSAIPKDIPDRDDKIQKCREMIPQVFKEAMQRVRPFPGVESALKHFLEKGLQLGLATASGREALQCLNDRSMNRFFKAVVSREDGLPEKPSPALILECLKRMGVDPRNAIAVGDSPLDLRAGALGGLLTIGVLSGIGSRSLLEAENPAIIIDNVTQLPSILDSEQLRGLHDPEE